MTEPAQVAMAPRRLVSGIYQIVELVYDTLNVWQSSVFPTGQGTADGQ